MFAEYIDFFSKFNVLGLAIGLMIGSNLEDVAGTFIDDVLMPFINPFIKTFTNEDGVEFTVPRTKIKINLERVLGSSIKFLALSFIIFLMLQFGIKLKKPVQWVSVRNWEQINTNKGHYKKKGKKSSRLNI